jgi:hypothetical protein
MNMNKANPSTMACLPEFDAATLAQKGKSGVNACAAFGAAA